MTWKRRLYEYSVIGLVSTFIMGAPALGVPLMAISDMAGNQIVGVTSKGEVMIMPGNGSTMGVSNWPSSFDINFPNPLPVSLPASPLQVTMASNPTVNVASGTVAVSSMPSVTISSAPPVSGAVTTYQNSSGPVTPPACDSRVSVSNNSSAVLITHVSGKTTYICGFNLALDLTLSATASLAWGTGTNCGSSTAQMSGVIQNAALGLLTNGSISEGAGVGAIDQSPVAGVSDLCIRISGGGTSSGSVRYTIY